ncbi:MAG: glycosyltransferase [Planctomycetaceae bacterium]|nr:glycosyltransferase [Planctomycetaceae bacterium]
MRGSPRLLQVCNVGTIVGGTGACAWSVTRSLPGWDHVVACFGPWTAESRRWFEGGELTQIDVLTAEKVREARADVVLLHNTSVARVTEELPVPALSYVHSRCRFAAGDRTLACSRWLGDQLRGRVEGVLYQGVPQPPREEHDVGARDSGDFVVGRLCTPTVAKWPREALELTAGLARQFPGVRWELVGCPNGQRTAWNEATQGRVAFWEAAWEARRHFWRWHALVYHNPAITETFGRTVAEAMRAGCVPIVDDRGGFREQVEPETGVLCRTDGEFAEALGRLQSRDDWRVMSDTAMQRANERFGLERFGGELLRQFALAGEGRRRRDRICDRDGSRGKALPVGSRLRGDG